MPTCRRTRTQRCWTSTTFKDAGEPGKTPPLLRKRQCSGSALVCPWLLLQQGLLMGPFPPASSIATSSRALQSIIHTEENFETEEILEEESEEDKEPIFGREMKEQIKKMKGPF
jgi:hypothetical protein